MSASSIARPALLVVGFVTFGRWIMLTAAVGLFWLAPNIRGNVDAVLSVSLTAIAVLVVAIFLWSEVIKSGGFWMDPPVCLLVVFTVWHLGFWIVFSLGMASDYRVDQYMSLAPGSTNMALSLCVGAVAALALGISLGRRLPVAVDESSLTGGSAPAIAAILGGLLAMLYFVSRGRSLVGDYDAVFTEADPLRRLYNLGLVLVVGAFGPLLIGAKEKGGFRSLAISAAWATVAISLALGSRWVVFTILVLWVSVRSIQRRKVRIGLLLSSLILLVILGTFAKEWRARNALSVSSVVLERPTNPAIEFLEEIGQAFLSVVGVIELERSPADRLHGQTILTAATSIVPSMADMLELTNERPTYRIARALYPQRFEEEGFTVGFSMVAELFMNFGVLGVAFGMFIVGYLTARAFGLKPHGVRWSRLLPALAVFSFLVFGIRNDSLTWFRYATWAAVTFWIVGRQWDTTAIRPASV